MPTQIEIVGRVSNVDGTPFFQDGAYLHLVARYLNGEDQRAGGLDALAIVQPENADYAFGPIDPLTSADFVGFEVRVSLDAHDFSDPIGRSPLIVGVQGQETVDFTVDEADESTDYPALRGPSEFDRLSNTLGQFERTPIDIAELASDLVPLVSVKAGIEPRSLMLLRRSADIAASIGVDATTFQPLVFGLARMKMPLDAISLALCKDEEIDEAIDAAIVANVLPAEWADGTHLDARHHFKSKLREHLETTGSEKLLPLFTIADIDAAKLTELLPLHQQATSREDFWSQATVSEENPSAPLSAIDADKLRDTLQLAALTLDHQPLVGVLMGLRNGGQRLETFAGFDVDDWTTRLSSAKPDRFAGSVDDFAIELERRFEEAYPTAATLLRLPRLPLMPDEKAEVEEFYTANPDFDLQLNPVSDYEATAELSSSAREFLGNVQRLSRLTPEKDRYKHIEAMLGKGITSAHLIAEMTPFAYANLMNDVLSGTDEEKREQSLRTHRNAQNVVGTVTALLMRHNSGFEGTHPAVVGPPETSELSDILEFDARASCPHCRSIFGPAAYLSDLLAFLKSKPAVGFSNLLEALKARRPDLVHIDLACDNTHVELPTIDLINEVLEAAYALETGITSPMVSRQTSGDAKERRAEPEHCLDHVYSHPSGHAKALDERLDHLELPFDLGRATLRSTLELMDIDSGELLAALATDAASRHTAARELLGIRNGADGLDIERESGDVLTQATVESLWGNTPLASLVSVETLIPLTGLEYRDLAATLSSPTFGKTISFDVPGDIETATVSPSFSVDEADLLRRMLKLQRRCGWTFRDVERGVAIVGGGALDAATVQELATIERLHRRFRLDRETLINFAASQLDAQSWGDEPSLRERVLPGFSGSDTSSADDHRSAIADALGLHIEDLPATFNGATVGAVLPALARHVTFARLLRVSFGTYVAMRELLTSSGIESPAEISSAETLESVLDDLVRLKHGPATIDEARYMVGLSSAIDAEQSEIFNVLDVLAALGNETKEQPNETSALVLKKLTEFSGLEDDIAERLAKALTAPDGPSLWDRLLDYETATDEAMRDQIREDSANGLVTFYCQSMLITACQGAKSEIDWFLSLPGFGELGTTTADAKAAVVTSFHAVEVKASQGLDELLDFIAPADSRNDEDWSTELAERIEMEAAAIGTLVSCLGRPTDVPSLDALFRAFGALGKRPATVSAVTDALPAPRFWVFDDGVTAEQLQRVAEAARAGRDAGDWQEFVAPATDRVREQKRDALATAALLEGLADKREDLYGEVLIDFEMDAKQDTSRIKAAISSTQQFIQRLFLGLEAGQQLTDEDATAWEWMRVYRIWEANRKVFVYPENWLKPEFRDDKTPFFEELESELAQGDVSVERVEAAVTNYLEKLHEVSYLETCSLHQGEETLHMLGRTKSEPRNYYYRSRTGQTWAPWERIEVDVEGDHMLLVERHRRLYLLWLLFDETSPTPQPAQSKGSSGAGSSDGDSAPDESPVPEEETVPKRYHSMRLCYAERKHGRWQRPRLSKRSLHWKSNSSNAEDPFFLKNSDDELRLFRFYDCSKADSDDLLVEPIRIQERGRDELDGMMGHEPERRGHFGIDAATGEIYIDETTDQKLVVRRGSGYVPSAQLVESSTESFALPCQDPMTKSWTMSKVLGQVTSPFQILPPSDAPFVSRHGLPVAFSPGNDSFLVEPEIVLYTATPPAVDLDVERGVVEHWEEKLAPGVLLGPAHEDLLDPWQFDPAGPLGMPVQTRLLRAHRDIFEAKAPEFGLLQATLNAKENSLAGLLSVVAGRDAVPMTTQLAGVGEAQLQLGGMSNALRVRSAGAPAVGGWVTNVNDVPAPMNTLLTSSTYAAPLTTPIVTSTQGAVFGGGSWTFGIHHLRFSRLIHPLSYQMLREVNVGGIWALYRPADVSSPFRRQQGSDGFRFDDFRPKEDVLGPREGVDLVSAQEGGFDFRPGSPMGVYNWELFVHVPLFVANKLRLRGEYAEARRWLHTIFDPTTGGQEPRNERFWHVKPFYEATKDGPSLSLDELMAFVDPAKVSTKEGREARQRFVEQVDAWCDEPFSPHAIARLRVRAYQTSVVMAYLDVLMEWADSLFRRDTMESINEATQLYMLAAEMLGARPTQVPGNVRPKLSFDALPASGGHFHNAKIELENKVLDVPKLRTSRPRLVPQPVDNNTIVEGPDQYLYFGIPENERLIDLYWDRVADRLFKIHHSQNIEGVERKLRLFEPPIDPELLIRAKAMGLKLSDVLKNLNRPLGPYRFDRLLGSARSFCQELQTLESMLLVTLEKRDAEELSRLRSTQEVELDSMIKSIRRKQVDEAREQLSALRKSRANIAARQAYYAGRPYQNAEEKSQLNRLDDAEDAHMVADATQMIGAFLRGIPTPEVGTVGVVKPDPVFVWPPVTTIAANIADGISTCARVMANYSERQAHRSGIRAAQARRQDDWDFQAASAERELATIDKQILAAEIRLAIAQKELENHRTAAMHRKEAFALLRQKFSRYELYDWMVGEICRLHQQAYELALELAERAQHAYCFDLGKPEASLGKFVRPQPLTGLKTRLLAGQELATDLRRMEAAYLEENKRLYEVTRHISLAALDPQQLLNLRSTGSCSFALPEELFDLDLPGHYQRRIKSVAISIPSTAGPYEPLHAELALTANGARTSMKADSYNDYIVGRGESDRYHIDWMPKSTSVVTSGGEVDTGLFELNLNDPRYLPFEGAGVVSSWELDLPPTELASFDYQSISDVVLHLRYTSLSGGDGLRSTVAAGLQSEMQRIASLCNDASEKGKVLIDLPSAFPTQWQALLSGQMGTEVSIPIEAGFFPFQLREKTISVTSLDVQASVSHTAKVASGATIATPSPASPVNVGLADQPGATIKLTAGGDPTAMQALTVLLEYSV